MQSELPGPLCRRVRQFNLREDLAAPPPSPGETLENGTVLKAALRQTIVEILNFHRLSTCGRPYAILSERPAPAHLLVMSTRAKRAHGVARPLALIQHKIANRLDTRINAE